MLNNKQKKYLKAQAHHLTPFMQIGKDGLSNNSFITINQALEKHELVKISVLNSCPSPKLELILDINSHCHCELVQSIGRVIVLFKASKEKRYQLPQ